jgi:uncharacterized NAD(P)/FAD-binding protein YdhS
MRTPTPSSPTTLDPADVVIIGAGVAGTSTLLRLLEAHRLAGNPHLRVVLIERSPDLYAGLPYGTRSGSASLIVTPLRDFLPDGLRADFIDWLEARSARILSADPSLGISASWVEDHAAEIRSGRWEDLFIPRRLFGLFLGDLVPAEIERTPGAEVATIRGEARSVSTANGRSVIEVATSSGTTEISTRAVVLALGSPPKQHLPRSIHQSGVGHFVEDTHTDTMDDLISDLRRHVRALPEGASRDALIVGANADALELLHAVHRTGLTNLWNRRITILSPHGTPDAWTVHPDHSDQYRSQHLRHWSASTADADLTASGIYEATAHDVDDALAEGFSEQDTVPELKQLTEHLLDRLPEAEQHAFVRTYGNLVNRFSRPTGGDYQQVASRLLAERDIEIVDARFEHATAGPAGWTVSVGSPAGSSQLEGTYGLIVNCTGFQTLDSTEDPLLRSLLDTGTVTATPSRRGIMVDDRFQAAPGVFVAGPLLAGNLTETLRVWHLESCRRILAMSPDIGAEVAAHLQVPVSAGV